jgi:(1->4)-alpha-D-glucan 1-alpha-D-glucosylmutase
MTVATRLPAGLAAAGGWRGTVLELPAGSWTDALTARAVAGGLTAVGDLLDRYPVALLTRDV